MNRHMGKLAKVRGEGREGVSQSSASLRLIELRLEAWQQAAILSDTGGNVNDVNDATGARVFQNKLINCLVAPTNFTTHPGPDVRPHMSCPPPSMRTRYVQVQLLGPLYIVKNYR